MASAPSHASTWEARGVPAGSLAPPRPRSPAKSPATSAPSRSCSSAPSTPSSTTTPTSRRADDRDALPAQLHRRRRVGAVLFAPVRRFGRRVGDLILALAALGAIGIALGTLVSLLVSEYTPLFGFMESGYRLAIVLTLAFDG